MGLDVNRHAWTAGRAAALGGLPLRGAQPRPVALEPCERRSQARNGAGCDVALSTTDEFSPKFGVTSARRGHCHTSGEFSGTA